MRPKSYCGDREWAPPRRRLRALKMTTHASDSLQPYRYIWGADDTYTGLDKAAPSR